MQYKALCERLIQIDSNQTEKRLITGQLSFCTYDQGKYPMSDQKIQERKVAYSNHCLLNTPPELKVHCWFSVD